MALPLGDNLSYQGAKPLDARLKYADLATMKAVADATMYDGCLAYCVATDKTYQWKSTNSVDATLGRWREFSSGGGGGSTTLAGLDDTLIANPSDGQVLGYDGATNKWRNKADQSQACYKPTDDLGSDIEDNDYFPTYQGRSALWSRKNIKWSRVKATLKTYFDTLYGTITAGTGLELNNAEMSIKEFESGDMEEVMSPLPSVQPRYQKYSTEEQIVGEWIGGEPLYQCTYSTTITSTSGTIGSMPTGALPKNIWGAVRYNSNGSIEAIPKYDSDSNRCKIYTDGTAVKYACSSGYASSSLAIWVTVQYTKTTD